MIGRIIKKYCTPVVIILFSQMILLMSSCGNDTVETSASALKESEEESKRAEEESIKKAEEESIQKAEEESSRKAEQEKQIFEFLKLYCNNDENFVSWLLQTYGSENFANILSVGNMQSEDAKKAVSKHLYNITGKTYLVLQDEYNGLLVNDAVAAENNIYFRYSDDGVIDLTFAGDICLTEDGFVIDHYDEKGQGITGCISAEIINLANDADVFMINHEYPVSERGTPLEGKYYTFRANPERQIIISQLGTDIVSLANNHIYDYGADAFYDTLDNLKNMGLPYVGAGRNIEEAASPVYFIVDGMKIGYVSANRSEKIVYTPEAKADSPGVVRMYDTAMLNQIISEVAPKCDYLIAYVHWGTEDSNKYETYQTDIAAELFASGADAIIGSHPHVLQGIQYVSGKPVVYSLGDFWFNHETKYTTMVNLKVNIDGLYEMSIVPCRQEGYETHYLQTQEEQAAFYEYVRKLSPGCNISEQGVITKQIN